jgi:hypothetical protein
MPLISVKTVHTHPGKDDSHLFNLIEKCLFILPPIVSCLPSGSIGRVCDGEFDLGVDLYCDSAGSWDATLPERPLEKKDEPDFPRTDLLDQKERNVTVAVVDPELLDP